MFDLPDPLVCASLLCGAAARLAHMCELMDDYRVDELAWDAFDAADRVHSHLFWTAYSAG